MSALVRAVAEPPRAEQLAPAQAGPDAPALDRPPRRADRSALARLAGAPDDALVGAPGDPAFARRRAPDVVLLGLAGDFEAELEFAHRAAARARTRRWILVVRAHGAEAARRLFDALAAELLALPAGARAAAPAGARARAPRRRRAAPALALRARVARRVAARFARWFADLELPALLRALDPRSRTCRCWSRGEPGTGRGALARYVHVFGGGAAGPLVHVAVRRARRTRLGPARRDRRGRSRGGAGAAPALCLLDVDALRSPVQRAAARLDRDRRARRAARARAASAGSATAGEATRLRTLDPTLRRALAGSLMRASRRCASGPRASRAVDAAARLVLRRAGERPRRFGEDALARARGVPLAGEPARARGRRGADARRAARRPVRRTISCSTASRSRRSTPRRSAREIIELGEPEPAEPRSEGELAAEAIFEPEPSPRRRSRELGAAARAGPRAPLQVVPEAQPAPRRRPPRRTGSARARSRRSPPRSRTSCATRWPAIRTFAELLPRALRATRVPRRASPRGAATTCGASTRSLERLARSPSSARPRRDQVDVTALLEELLEALPRPDPRAPPARAEGARRAAPDRAAATPSSCASPSRRCSARCFALVPERGDVYLALEAPPGGPAQRPVAARAAALPRRRRAARRAPGIAGVSLAETSLDLVLAELVVARPARQLHGQRRPRRGDADRDRLPAGLTSGLRRCEAVVSSAACRASSSSTTSPECASRCACSSSDECEVADGGERRRGAARCSPRRRPT